MDDSITVFLYYINIINNSGKTLTIPLGRHPQASVGRSHQSCMFPCGGANLVHRASRRRRISIDCCGAMSCTNLWQWDRSSTSPFTYANQPSDREKPRNIWVLTMLVGACNLLSLVDSTGVIFWVLFLLISLWHFDKQIDVAPLAPPTRTSVRFRRSWLHCLWRYTQNEDRTHLFPSMLKTNCVILSASLCSTHAWLLV